MMYTMDAERERGIAWYTEVFQGGECDKGTEAEGYKKEVELVICVCACVRHRCKWYSNIIIHTRYM